MRHDLRMALRSLAAAPIVTSAAILSLALAIGANTAIFSIVNSLMLRSLPVLAAERLVHVTDSVRRDTGEVRVRAWSHPFWEELRARPDLFDGATAWSFVRFNRAEAGETRFADGIWADGGFFDLLGVRPALGRTFRSADDRRGGGPDGPITVISHACWQREFGGAADVLGRSVRLNGAAFTIVGVTPPGFFGLEVGRSFDFIVPLQTEALIRGQDSALDSASTNFLTILARLKPGQSPEAAAAGLRAAQPGILAAMVAPMGKDAVDRYLSSPFTVVPAAAGYSNLRRTFERPLLVIAVVVALILLIGCVNVANLLLARSIARRHELSVQVALGASRWRLARQLFAESALLSSAGAALGIVLAMGGARFLVRQLSTPTATVVLDLSFDVRVLVFTAAVAILTALLFGTVPSLRAAGVRPIEALNERGRSAAHGRGGLMAWLVTVQVALSTVLLVSAGLFVRSFVSLAGRQLGIEPAQVLVVTVDPQRTNVEQSRRVALYERVLAAVRPLPGVAGAAISHLTPLGGGGFTPTVEVAGAAASLRIEPNAEVYGNLTSPGWFATFGTPIVAGRDFADADRRGAPGVAIVNETFARRYFAGVNPLGRSLTIYPGTPRALRMQVVGVAADAIYSSPRELAPPTWYVPIAQFDVAEFPFSSIRLSVRAAAGSPAQLAASVAAAAATVEPRLVLTSRVLGAQLRAALTLDRLMAQLAGFFGGLALLLAALGLYGVTAYTLSRRRTEIGIRLALGAAPRTVVGLVLRRVSMVIAVGVIAGAILSVWALRFAAGLLYGLTPGDPATLLDAAGVLFSIGLVAAWLPARRAARTDPAAVLRDA